MTLALVVGGAGFLGSHLVDRLLEQEVDVRVLDNLSAGSLRNLQGAVERNGGGPGRGPRRLELMVGDVRDERLVRKAVRHVDCVYHLAAVPGAWAASPRSAADIHTVNVHGTLNVLQGATAEGVRRLVFASCTSVYGEPAAAGPVAEDAPARPVTVFAASKLAGEIYCRAYHAAGHLETVILRYAALYGPRAGCGPGDAGIAALVDALRRRRRPLIEGSGRTPLDLLYVEDAADATLAAGTAPPAAGRVINLGSGQAASALEVVDILNRLLRTSAVPRLAPGRPGRPAAAPASIEAAREVLGFRPRVSLVAGLARSVEFLSAVESQDERLAAAAGARDA